MSSQPAMAVANADWSGFIGDAAALLHVREELDNVLPFFIEQPLNPAAQRSLRELLASPVLDRATRIGVSGVAS